MMVGNEHVLFFLSITSTDSRRRDWESSNDVENESINGKIITNFIIRIHFESSDFVFEIMIVEKVLKNR